MTWSSTRPGVALVDVDRLKQEIDVWMVLDEVGAQRRGRKVFCPWCADAFSRNPGASVTPDDSFYKCFVCGFGGDIIGLAREHLGPSTTFKEACAWLATTFSVD